MKIQAALQGNLKEVMEGEFHAATEGVVEGVREATRGLEAMLRAQVRSAGLGKWLEKAWKGKVYLNHRIDAAGVVRPKRFAGIIAGFDQGITIRARNKKYLAVAVPWVRDAGRYRRGRITPTRWPARRFGQLVFLPGKTGDAVLMAVKKYKRKAPQKKVAFVLLRQTRLRKRLDIDRAERRITALLPKLILKHYREEE